MPPVGEIVGPLFLLNIPALIMCVAYAFEPLAAGRRLKMTRESDDSVGKSERKLERYRPKVRTIGG